MSKETPVIASSETYQAASSVKCVTNYARGRMRPEIVFRTTNAQPTGYMSCFPIRLPLRAPVLLYVYHLLLVGSGLGLLVTLLSSRPLTFNHFFVDNSISRSSSGLGTLRCMKLQKPPRTQPSPLFRRQHASRKSVTGESSQ